MTPPSDEETEEVHDARRRPRRSAGRPSGAREGRSRASQMASVAATAVVANVDVFESSILSIAITDRAGRLRRINPAFARLLGRSRDELVGAPFSSLTNPEDQTRTEAILLQLTRKVTETASFEKRYIRPDGVVVWVEMNVRALTGDEGEVVGFLAQPVDITDRKRADEAVTMAYQRLGEAERIAGLGSLNTI